MALCGFRVSRKSIAGTLQHVNGKKWTYSAFATYFILAAYNDILKNMFWSQYLFQIFILSRYIAMIINSILVLLGSLLHYIFIIIKVLLLLLLLLIIGWGGWYWWHAHIKYYLPRTRQPRTYVIHIREIFFTPWLRWFTNIKYWKTMKNTEKIKILKSTVKYLRNSKKNDEECWNLNI